VSGRPGDLPAQGERFQIFDEVVALNSESSREFGHESLARAERRFDPVIALSILALGGLIMALGFAARHDDRARRRSHRFSQALQAARTEPEAYELVGAHLQREVPSSKVAVFNRNNSADRLEASTPLDGRGCEECVLWGRSFSRSFRTARSPNQALLPQLRPPFD
jgi:hypothetical protein